MSMLKAIFVFTVLTAGFATEVLPGLEADDECAADGGDDGCALNALQMHARRGQGDLLTKINGMLSSKVGEMNAKLSAMLKAKDPMPLKFNKGKVNMKQLSGLDSLKIDSLKATAMNLPHVTFAMTANWASALKISGQMSGRKPATFNVQMQKVSFETQHIVATLDPDTGAITTFNVSQVKVNMGASPVVQVQMQRRFWAQMMEDKIKKKFMHDQAKVSGAIGGKITGVLNTAFNGKLKDALNKKLESLGGKVESTKMPTSAPVPKALGGGKAGDGGMISKVNGALSSKLGEMNDKMGGMLKAKDPMSIEMKHGKVEMNKLYGMSSLRLDSFHVKTLDPPVVTLGISADWSSPLKLVGAASMRGPVPFNVELMQTSFYTHHIVAHLDPNTGAFQNFKASRVHVDIGNTAVHAQIRMRYFANIVNKQVNAMLQKKKGEIAGKIAVKVEETLNTVLNGKMKGVLNKKMQEMAR